MDNDFEFAKGNVYRISETHMTQLFKSFQVKNIEELRSKLELKSVPLQNVSKEEKERLQNLDLTLNIFTKIKKLEMDLSFKQIQNVLLGVVTLKVPENLPLITQGFTPPEELDVDEKYCEHCTHDHLKNRDWHCKFVNCKCGVRF